MLPCVKYTPVMPKKTRLEWNQELLWLIFKPLAKFCVKRSITIQVALEALKRAFIEAAKEELESRGEKVNISKIAVVSGMHRRDVMRIHRSDEPSGIPQTLISKVLTQWEQSSEYSTTGGKGRVLNLETDFKALVSSVSQDLNPATVLFELERSKLVERTSRGIKLRRAEQIITDPTSAYKILSSDVEDLIFTVDKNIFDGSEVDLHARTEFDNIRVQDVPKIKKWLLEEGRKLHQKARSLLAKHDNDANPLPDKEAGVKVSLGSFARIVNKSK